MSGFKYFAGGLTVVSVLFLFACQKEQYDMDNYYKMYGTGLDTGLLIEQVNGMKVYFGHQSVGENILHGIENWENETGIQLEKADSRNFITVTHIPFVHFPIGANQYAMGKIDDFEAMIGQIQKEENPVAFFKFCYVDVYNETDIAALFSYFKEKMLFLKGNNPNITFLVCTVPVTGVQKGMKATVKRVLGRAPYGFMDNIKRSAINDMIRSEFSGVLPVFDLAALEATQPDGTTATFRYKGNDYPYMPGYYSTDYGHLNEFGARMISYNLLAFLAEELK